MKNTGFFFIFFILLSACSPKVVTNLQTNYNSLSYNQEIIVLTENEEAPVDAELIGNIKVGDNGFSTNCGYPEVLDLAKNEARKAGGNIIKITEHKLPSVMGSSCHQIKADILRVADLSAVQKNTVVEEITVDPNADYATLYVYRFSGVGPIVSYDLHLGDDIICRVKNKSKQTIQVNKLGYNSIWAKTESKAEIPVNLEAGHEYYIRCGLKMGVMVGRPSIELVDNKTGKMEFESLKTKK